MLSRRPRKSAKALARRCKRVQGKRARAGSTPLAHSTSDHLEEYTQKRQLEFRNNVPYFCGTPSRGGQILCLLFFRRLCRRCEIARGEWRMTTVSSGKNFARGPLPFSPSFRISALSALSATLAPKTGRGRRRRLQEMQCLAKRLDARLASATKRTLPQNPGGHSGRN